MADAIDDGLIKALEAADERLCELTPNFPPDVGPDMRDAEEIEKTGAVVMQIREALSRHKAPLSVAGDDVGLAERIATIIAFNRNKSNFEIARTILTALQVTEGDKVEKRPDGFVGMHFDECDYFISRGTKPCSLDCCS